MDIVSRIKLEAEGADAAAREILKLKQAYEETGKAARAISPTGVGAADPFARATSSTEAFDNARTASVREGRNAEYRKQQQDREDKHQSSAAKAAGRLPGAVSGAVGAVEAAGQGQGMGAIGGALGAAAGFLGPLGVAALATGALFKGVEHFAGKEMDRLEMLWGSGMTQRLGMDYGALRDKTIDTARSGIPLEMINQGLQTASQSGVALNKGNMSQLFGMSLEAGVQMGVAPGTSAALLGGLQRAGMGNMGTQEFRYLYGMIKNQFGVENIGRVVDAVTQGLEGALASGIAVGSKQFNQQVGMLGALSGVGGLSPTGAIGANQLLINRGRSAAGLSKPEDVIAFTAMRQSGKGVFETMKMMEENPEQVNRAVYDYLKEATGGNQDLLSMRFHRYLGGTIGQTAGIMKTFEGYNVTGEGVVYGPEGTATYGGMGASGWMPGKTVQGAESGEQYFTSLDPIREAFARQNYALTENLEKWSMKVEQTLKSVFQGEIILNAVHIWSGGKHEKSEPVSLLDEEFQEYYRISGNPALKASSEEMRLIGFDPSKNEGEAAEMMGYGLAHQWNKEIKDYLGASGNYKKDAEIYAALNNLGVTAIVDALTEALRDKETTMSKAEVQTKLDELIVIMRGMGLIVAQQPVVLDGQGVSGP